MEYTKNYKMLTHREVVSRFFCLPFDRRWDLELAFIILEYGVNYTNTGRERNSYGRGIFSE